MKIKKILMLLAVAGLLGACSSDEEARVTSEPVPIWLSATVEGSQTRAATTSTTGDEVLLGGQDVDAYIKVKGGDWLAQPKACTVTGTNGDLTYSGDLFYPMDGTPVSIYAVHPSIASAATFTVQSDQTDDANYAASDLSYSKTADYNRSESPQTLTFKHLLSKIIVKVQTDLGTVNRVKLRAKKSTTLTYPVDNDDGYTLGTASGAGMIEMNAGSAVNDGGAIIIPPQTTAAVGDVRIIVEIDGKGTFVYNFLAGTTFASNTEYTYTVKIGASITVTSSISAWGYNAAGTLVNADDINNKTVQIGRPKLPIEYVADYNMKTATAFATSDVPSQTAYFTWNVPANLNAFKNGTAVAGYHLPSKREWCTIIPPYRAYNSTTPDSDIDDPEGPRIGSGCGKKTNMGEYMSWGVTNNNGTYTYEVSRKFYNDYNSIDDPAHERIFYALRFRDKDGSTYKNGLYTCAYRYQYFYDETISANSYLVIKVKYVGFNQNIDIDAISDEGWWLTSDFSKSFSVTGCYGWDGVFYPAGSYGASSDKFRQPWRMYYWSCSSIDADSHWATIIGPGFFMAGEGGDKLYSFPVRLFKDVGTP